MGVILEKQFFLPHVTKVAQNLIGKRLFFKGKEGVIVETEAYRGSDDLASHAAKGRTPRNAIMFGSPGVAYIYMIYGMHYCFNIVCESEGQPAAVLVRGLLTQNARIDGPGKLCRHLGLDLTYNGVNLLSARDFYLTEGISIPDIQVTSRIGISKAQDKLWRFVCPSLLSIP